MFQVDKSLSTLCLYRLEKVEEKFRIYQRSKIHSLPCENCHSQLRLVRQRPPGGKVALYSLDAQITLSYSYPII
jgi:hypothetical protein